MTTAIEPTNYVYVPLHVKLYADLVRRSGRADVSAFVGHSVEIFLEKTIGDPIIVSGKGTDETGRSEEYGDPRRGYHWKTLFLPNGTQIEMPYRGQKSRAEIRHEGFWSTEAEEYTSPAKFARRVANNTSRNAWRDLYIQFPGGRSWKLADSLRRGL